MIRVKILSKLNFNLPSNFQQVEEDEEIVLLDIFSKADLDKVKNFSCPIIIFAEEEELILQANANDCILYPFNEKELEIRIKVVLSKSNPLMSCDLLTGLPDKHYLYSCYKELAKIQQPISILMIDIDNFKEINDLQGHLQGDEILKEVAKILKYSIRNSDLLARFGGDEFIVMLPDTPLDGAYVVGERISKSIEKKCHVSIGVSSSSLSCSIEDLINKADRALYIAKKQGGNKVIKA